MKILLISLTILSVFQLGSGYYTVRYDIINSINFGFGLYQNLFDSHKNTVFSPLSFRVLLSLLYQGAPNETITFDDIRTALYLSEDKSQTYRIQKQNLDRIFTSTNIKLANKIYIRDGAALKPDFINVVQGFKSDIEQVNFSRADTVAANMNQWVEEKTNGLIRDLVDPSVVTPDTALFLLNSIYFKAKWIEPYDPSMMRKQEFRGRNKKKQILFITDLGFYKIARGLPFRFDADVLEIPYEVGSNFVFWIILPRVSSDIQEVANGLNSLRLHRINDSFEYSRYDIMFPQFEIESEIDGKELFTKFRIGSLFENAELDLLEDAHPLKADEVRQKTKIIVNTDGTEAATTTYLKAVPTSVFPKFYATRPFIFGVFTADKLEPVFLGHYINPV